MYIVAQSTYIALEIALYNGTTLVNQQTIAKKDACAQLITVIDTLLRKEGITHTDPEGIIVVKGPGPFSSLRTLIATMNGIAYATGIPLFGVSALDVLNHAYNPDNSQHLVIVLQAYSKEYYYGLTTPEQSLQIGVCAYDQLPVPKTQTNTLIIGHTQALTTDIWPQAQRIERSYCTLEEVAQYGMHMIKQGLDGSHHISPLYIKTHF